LTIERLLEAARALEAGDLARAEQIYRQVAEADPRSSIAMVGLARVALRRGSESEGLRLAKAALAIDPESPAARRLVDAHPSVERDDAAGGAVDGALRGAADAEWPWPDLKEQLAQYRKPAPGLLGRLLRRGRG
jgi:hypothetical protein